MTPKEKAKELVYKMYVKYEPKIDDKGGIYYFNMSIEVAKQSALICVDEILKQHKKIIVSHNITAYKSKEDFNNNLTDIQNQLDSYVLSKDSYWEQVKQEINNL